MPAFIDITGYKLRNWTVTSYSGRGKWLCQCVCGKTSIFFGQQIRRNRLAESCGCTGHARLKREIEKMDSYRRDRMNTVDRPYPQALACSYIAGFFDGEGCVTLEYTGRDKAIGCFVTIINTNREVIEYINSLFSGGLFRIRHQTNSKWKTAYIVRFGWDHAISFLSAISPWARVKRQQLDIAMEWNKIRPRRSNHGHGKRRDLSNHQRMEDLRIQLKRLNAKGPPLSEGGD